MFDILTDETKKILFLMKAVISFEDERIFLASEIAYLIPWRLKDFMDLYDTDGVKRLKVQVPIPMRRAGEIAVYKTEKMPFLVKDIYLL